MKKILAILLSLALALTLCACGTGGNAAPTESPAAETAGEEIPNPITVVTAQELLDRTGISFTVPDGAENIVYSVIDQGDGSTPLAQMSFRFGGADCACRAKSAGIPDGALEDISGYYYDWTSTDSATVGTNTAELHWIEGQQGWIGWYDTVPGILYCVSMSVNATRDMLVALAESSCPSLQGDADGDINADSVAALQAIFADLAQGYQPGSSGCSLRAARYAAMILDWGAASANPQSEAREATDAYCASLTAQPEGGPFRDLMADIYDAAKSLCAANGAELLDACGYQAQSYPWDSTAMTTLFDVITAETEKDAVSRGILPLNVTSALPYSFDLDGDGAKETIEAAGRKTDEYGNMAYSLHVTGGKGEDASQETYIIYNPSVWLADLDGDGTVEVFLCGDCGSDDYITYCWRWNGALESVKFSGEVRNGADAGGDYADGAVESIRNGGLTLGSFTYMLGTYGSERIYRLTEDGGIAPVEGTIWTFPNNSMWLQTSRELSVVLDDGTSAVLPSGTRLLLTGTDGVSETYFQTEDGRTGTLSVSRTDAGWLVSGVNENDCFVSLPYAG